MATYAGRKRRAPSACTDRSPLKAMTNESSLQRASKRPFKKIRLTQSVLAFGQKPPKPCPRCRMPYQSHILEDVKLHEKYCKVLDSKNSISTTQSFHAVATKLDTCVWRIPQYEDRSDGHRKFSPPADLPMAIFGVARTDMVEARRLAESALSIAEDELGALRTTQDELWSTWVPHCAKHRTKARETQLGVGRAVRSAPQSMAVESDRYKVFLVVVRNRCIGICLAERIAFGHKVTFTADSLEDATVCVGGEPMPATMGISRIWVSKEFRGSRVASNLLETARMHFLHGIEVDVHKIAFSQPTTDGAKFARRWFGLRDGWLVYRDD